tara:strand:- start:264 stop:521 length:258 start_codon:yes stop_codon:yes gene_type:complete
MAKLTEETLQDKIEIVGNYKILTIRTATVIKKDGTEISRSFHRHTVAPNADISNESAEVKAICKAVHTDKIKTAYKKHLESQKVG